MKVVEVTVRYFDAGKWGELETYQVVSGPSNPDKGIINENTSLAKKILNCQEGDIIDFSSDVKCLVEKIIADPEFTDLVKLGKEYYDSDNDEGLIKLGWKLIEMVSDSIVAQKEFNNLCGLVVSAHLTAGDVQNAIDWLSHLDSDKFEISTTMQKLLEIKDTQGGLIIKDIRNTYTLNRLAKLHKFLKAFRKAYYIYERSLSIDNNSSYTYNGLGGVCKDAGWYDRAIENYEKGLLVNNNIVSLTGLGATLRAMQSPESAIVYYKQALEINNYDKYANNGIGAAYFDCQLYDEGSKHFMIAGDTDYLLRLFWEYKGKELMDAALECLNLILCKDPGHPKASSLITRFGTNR